MKVYIEDLSNTLVRFIDDKNNNSVSAMKIVGNLSTHQDAKISEHFVQIGIFDYFDRLHGSSYC